MPDRNDDGTLTLDPSEADILLMGIKEAEQIVEDAEAYIRHAQRVITFLADGEPNNLVELGEQLLERIEQANQA